MMKKIVFLSMITLSLAMVSCMNSRMGMGNAMGGEVTGISGTAMNEPTPYGMVLVQRGSIKVGDDKNDSLWGTGAPQKTVSVDAFWMDETEVSNAKYRQFVFWVRDSIIRERLADPAYGGDETYKITEDEYGEPITPYLNWRKPIPWKKPTEDEQRAIESVYITNPITGEKMLDAAQMNYQLCSSYTECSHCKSGYVLVSLECYCEEAVYNTHENTAKESSQYGYYKKQHRVHVAAAHYFKSETSASATHTHNTGDTEVEVTCLFGKDFSRTTIKEGRSKRN